MKIIMIITILIMFLGWTYLMLSEKVDFLDKQVYQSFSFNKAKTRFFRLITEFGSTKFFIMACLLLLLLLDNKTLALVICVFMIIDAGIVGLVKNLIKRERPNINRLVKEKGYSYISGHTFSSVSFYSFIILLIWIFSIPLIGQIILTIMVVLLVILIGISRIYLGVHYFSDVIGALLLGLSYFITYVYFVYDVLKIL